MSFFEKLTSAISEQQSLLVIGLDPNPEMMPNKHNSQLHNHDLISRLGEWLELIIRETSDLVCAYKPTFGFYQALGSEGLNLLLQVLKFVPPEIPIILDAKHGDLNSSSILAQTIFNEWQVDAITVNPYAGFDLIAPFLVYPDKGVFILCRTSNPDAIALQEYPNKDNPFYLQVIKEAKTWGPLEQVYLEIGTTQAEILTQIRKIAPERLILLRSIWEDKTNLEPILKAGLNKNGEGLLIPVPQDFLNQKDLRQLIQKLNDKVNKIREQVQQENSSCDVWIPNICLLNQHPYQDLILQLYDIECLLFGEFVQASGATFSYYIDLRKIISNPQIFHQVVQAYGKILKDLDFVRIAGIPYGALPTATGLSLSLHYPMIFPRKEVKAHGTRRLIEGLFNPGEKVVVIDDILISGKSVMEGAEKLKSAGLEVEDIVIFIDHEKGVKDKLKSHGYNAHAVLTISEIGTSLYEANRISKEQYFRLMENH